VPRQWTANAKAAGRADSEVSKEEEVNNLEAVLEVSNEEEVEDAPAAVEDAPMMDIELEIDAILASGEGDAAISLLEDVEEDEEEDEEDEETKVHKEKMAFAVRAALGTGGEKAYGGPFPRPVGGAVLVAENGKILGTGRSNYAHNAVESALADAGIRATALREWCVAWPSDTAFRRTLSKSTLYVTLEPSVEREGEEKPPITQLIELSGIKRVVIGCQDPLPDCAALGAGSLHAAGVSVTMGILEEECQDLVKEYTALYNTKLQRMSRQHFKANGRPLGHLHCSVMDSDDKEAFVRNGNSFGKNSGGQHLGSRDFGTYEIAPPPEEIWAADEDDDVEDMEDFDMEFEEEDSQESLTKNPMMPWYEQVDACIATFPKPGNGPVDDPSISARLKGLTWLATNGKSLPAGVERVLVMDATDLGELPLSNDSPNLPPGVDIEEFWHGEGRRPSRVLLRHGDNAMAIAVAEAAARAAAAAAVASQKAREAIETGDAELAAEAALECQQAAMASNEFIQKEIQTSQDLKHRLISMGVKVETIKGSDPLDVMNHLGKRSGYKSVVWRAGCWGNRGVDAILAGAFQRVSAHLAVDAIGGKFWQLMLAERALQSACGPESKLKVFAEEDAINLEYCDREGADMDCALLFDGKPVRHVRLDARVAVIDEIMNKKKLNVQSHVTIKKKFHEEQAPWFL